jgi:hypothetical protein
MPSDPVKAVWWFVHWLLQVLVRFFWIPILGMVIYESVINWRADGASNGLLSAAEGSIIGGIFTLLVGLIVWAILYALLIFANIGANVARVVNELNQFQQKFSNHVPYSSSYSDDVDPKVVEGTISEVEEEPREQK